MDSLNTSRAFLIDDQIIERLNKYGTKILYLIISLMNDIQGFKANIIEAYMKNNF